MKNSEVRELTTAEIGERVEEESKLLVRQKLNHAVSPLDSPMKIRETRRLIARLNTELRQRKLNEKKSE